MTSNAKRTSVDQAAMRAAGFVQKIIWVPDVSAPGFAEECARQSRLLAEADAMDPSIESFTEAAWLELSEEITRSEK